MEGRRKAAFHFFSHSGGCFAHVLSHLSLVQNEVMGTISPSLFATTSTTLIGPFFPCGRIT